MTTPVIDVRITPDYGFGFVFTWAVSHAFSDPGPWSFVVEETISVPDRWTVISPRTYAYTWTQPERKLVNKDAELLYRIRMTTPNGDYYSEPVAPFGTLTKREYLLIKDMMRREILHAKTLAGVRTHIMLRSVFGPRCPICIDPITGNVRNSKCSKCFGTGYYPPYHGPYTTWMLFTPDNSKKEFHSEGSGVVQPRNFEIRLIGTMGITTGDVVIDAVRNKRYCVDSSQMVAELRRVPIIQSASISEFALSDPVYTLNINE